jgi:RNA polymerase sigma factor (sigma-70 family)
VRSASEPMQKSDSDEPDAAEPDPRGELERLHAESFAWALACCRRDRESAEDALQASYLKVLSGEARFDGRSRFRTFLFGVITRTAAEQRRARWRAWIGLERRARQGFAGPADPEDAAARSEEAQRLRRALTLLARRQRELLELVFAHEMTIEEAAGVLGISVGAARVHYQRGKRRLARLLA